MEGICCHSTRRRHHEEFGRGKGVHECLESKKTQRFINKLLLTNNNKREVDRMEEFPQDVQQTLNIYSSFVSADVHCSSRTKLQRP